MELLNVQFGNSCSSQNTNGKHDEKCLEKHCLVCNKSSKVEFRRIWPRSGQHLGQVLQDYAAVVVIDTDVLVCRGCHDKILTVKRKIDAIRDEIVQTYNSRKSDIAVKPIAREGAYI